MEVILAKTAGFCFGVQRAVDKVYEQIEMNTGTGKIYTYGPIIHNMEVVNDLKKKGAVPVDNEDELEDIAGEVLVIRSHGVSRRIYEKAQDLGIKIVDATCPFVKRIHTIVMEETQRGRRVIIVGDSTHPEVQGIMGWCDLEPLVVKNEEEASALPSEKGLKITIVAQTTFNSKKFNNIVEIIEKKGYDMVVKNTICSATMDRQSEAAQISSRVDAMLVIGDIHSSNTRKLYDICRSHCDDTYYIQTSKDLDMQNLQSGISVGITAGASTPNYIIQEVFLTCQKKKISTR